ncbi:hypothetical protein [Trinickia dabaoshanensis]|uniref:hypothetical protein n=1 Tax=Trinickia dabaoshanensis TaxID=564714 RepID=UPI001E2B3B93|nr:hypothetical protein [Trinickia dabaoshanensis]
MRTAVQYLPKHLQKVSSHGSLTAPLAAALFGVASLNPLNAQAQAPATLNVGGVPYTLCASEGQGCSFSGNAKVAYGSTSPTLSDSVNGPFANGVQCQNGVVSPTDPAYGKAKSCWYDSSTGYWKPAPTGAVTCSAPTTSTGGTPNGLITADVVSADRTRLFPQSSAFAISFVSAAPAADQVSWTVQDDLGNIKGSGHFPVPGGTQTSTISCTSTTSGYFAITATLTNAGGTLPHLGTRPTGIATFGVLPNLSGVLPAVSYAHQDQHRFGMQGLNGFTAMLTKLGVSRVIDDRQMSSMEPNGPNTWTPGTSYVSTMYKGGSIMRLVRLDGIPAWASPTGAYEDDTNAPTDLSYYQSYMGRVGTDTEAMRKTYFPNQQSNYYQVTWEPNWKDSSANFIALYKAVYTGLHATDPNAVVMGTTSPNPGACAWCEGGQLQTYGALGLGQYIDGVSTHSYYSSDPSPSQPPEQYDTDSNPANVARALDQRMRALRSQMQALKPNMRLWSSEVGISYDPGSAYGPNFPSGNQLYAQAAVAARTHLIVLGEGAQVTYFFYGADYPTEVGFGSFFDMVNPQGSWSAQTVSPKPEAMAFAALTNIIDGTQTLGRLNGLPTMAYGYAFQQLGGGSVITALWTHNNANWPTTAGSYSPTASMTYSLKVDNAGTNGTVTVLDMMGNPYTVGYANGVVNLTLTESPIYVVSNNASVMSAQVTAPIGYTGQ